MANSTDGLTVFAQQSNKHKILAVLYEASTPIPFDEIAKVSALAENLVRAVLNRDISEDLLLITKDKVKVFGLSERGKQYVTSWIAEFKAKTTAAHNGFADKIDAWRDLLQQHEVAILAALSSEHRLVEIPFLSVVTHDPDMAQRLLDDAEESMRLVNIALEKEFSSSATMEAIDDMHIAFVGLPESQFIPIRVVDHSYVGQLIAVEGIIKSFPAKKTRIVSTKFECPSCGSIIPVLQTDDTFKTPTRCSCGRRGQFKEVSSHKEPYQVLRIEEVIDHLNVNQQPRSIHVKLCGTGLTHKKIEMQFSQGGRVKISAVVRLKDQFVRNVRTVFQEPFLEANSIEFLHGDFKDVVVTAADEVELAQFANDALNNFDETLADVSHSFAPFIFGEDWMKAAIVLQMHAAPDTFAADGRSRIRNRFHVLLIGDPGTAKSECVLQVPEFVPRARFATGESSSGVGLTASVVKDELTGDWVAEAGILPSANNSIAVIDEIDKMPQEEQAKLHSAMTRGIVDIAKAGIKATLRAEACVLAAGNPKHARFDDYQSMTEQFNISSTLLNRFDIMCGLKDVVQRARDNNIAGTMSARMTGRASPQTIRYTKEFLRKKIMYTKTRMPMLEYSDEADEYLRNWYANVRASRHDKVVPINPRILEGAYRIALAIARFRLANLTDKKVSKADAVFALKLLENTTLKLLRDANGLDSDASEGFGTSRRGLMRKVMEAIDAIDSHNHGKGADTQIVVDRLHKDGIEPGQSEEIIALLIKKGDAYEPNAGKLKKVK